MKGKVFDPINKIILKKANLRLERGLHPQKLQVETDRLGMRLTLTQRAINLSHPCTQQSTGLESMQRTYFKKGKTINT